MVNQIKQAFNWLSILGGLLFGCLLLGAILGVLFLVRPESNPRPAGTALLQVISAPSQTPILPTETVTSTPTEAAGTPIPPEIGSMTIGSFVQIYGTGTDGLRLRSEPGLQGTIRFVAIEAEVFEITEGPQDVDGFTWWLLVAPYDANVRGWAVSNYLRPIQNP
jgi:hypothetical protein